MARDDSSTSRGLRGTGGTRSLVRMKTFELAPEAPPGTGMELPTLRYFLSYTLDSNGDPVFEAIEDPRPAASLWGKFLALVHPGRHLDIGIARNTFVEVETDGAVDLYWSDEASAVMTLRDRRKWYGELRYWDGSDWKIRSELAPDFKCRRIRFRAKRRPRFLGIFTHYDAFSYNVRYLGPRGDLVEYEIDPDIKNPSM